MHVALYMINPEHKEKTKHNMSGKGKGAQDRRLVDLSKDSDSDDGGGGNTGGGDEDDRKVRAKVGGAQKSKEKTKGKKDKQAGKKDQSDEEKITGEENEATAGLEGREVGGGDQETIEVSWSPRKVMGWE